MFEKRTKRTELAELGEVGLIHHLTEKLPIQNPSTQKGCGDDAAVLNFSEKQALISTELFIEGIHFDLTYFPLRHLGYKVAVAGISDIVAMNGTPTQILVGLGISNRFSVEAVDEIYTGIRMACEHYRVDLVGGDTTSSNKGLILSITALGEVETGAEVYRKGAKNTDLICVSGDLGSAYIGLLVLEREKQVYKANPKMQPDLEGMDYVIGRQLKPEAHPEVLTLLKENDILPTAMIDLTKGLAADVLHLCKQSDTGCNIYENKLPIDPTTAAVANDFKILPTTCALNGGDDFELLFTVAMNDFEKVKSLPGIHIIGHMTNASMGAALITPDNKTIAINAPGWEAELTKDLKAPDGTAKTEKE